MSFVDYIIKPFNESSGSKAYNLNLIQKIGFEVPDQLVIHNIESLISQDINIFSEIANQINFVEGQKVILRSSANLEDGSNDSFAGIFDSKVIQWSKASLVENLKKLIDLENNAKLISYIKSKKIDINDIKLNIIIQPYISFTLGGVLFTSSPISPHRGMLINVSKGQPKSAVDGDSVEEIYLDYIDNQKYKSKVLNRKQMRALVDVANKLRQYFKKNVDIEFGFIKNKLIILQVREITVFGLQKNIKIDSSNISENFPFKIKPLTYSVLQKMYKMTYSNLINQSGVSASKVYENMNIFNNLLVNLDGFVYYNIGNWYNFSKLIPGSKENNEGLKDMIQGLVVDDRSSPSFSLFQKLKYRLLVINKIISFKGKMKKFQSLMGSIVETYLFIDYEKFSLSDILGFWNSLSGLIDNETYIIAENDFLLMYYIQKMKKTFIGDDVETKNLAVLQEISDSFKLSSLSLEFEGSLKNKYRNKDDSFNLEFLEYEKTFYGRFPVDLDLEREIIDLKEKIVDSEIKTDQTQTKEHKKLKGVKKKIAYYLKNREINRLYRSQIFAIMRKMFDAIEDKLVDRGDLKSKGDIQFLSYSEIIEYLNLNSFNDLNDLVSVRKKSFTDSPISRDFKAGIGTEWGFRTNNYEKISIQSTRGDILSGLPCSQGKISGKAIVFESYPEKVPGEGIYVVKNLDPGWTSFLGNCKGLVIEEGGLLSHGAIVAREMRIPAIINIHGITKKLKSGEIIEVDGNTGKIIQLKK